MSYVITRPDGKHNDFFSKQNFIYILSISLNPLSFGIGTIHSKKDS
jgi:hypothetical protein